MVADCCSCWPNAAQPVFVALSSLRCSSLRSKSNHVHSIVCPSTFKRESAASQQDALDILCIRSAVEAKMLIFQHRCETRLLAS